MGSHHVGEIVPDIAFIGNACGDGFGGIDSAAAAQGDDHLHLIFAAKRNALSDKTKTGIGKNAGQGGHL